MPRAARILELVGRVPRGLAGTTARPRAARLSQAPGPCRDTRGRPRWGALVAAALCFTGLPPAAPAAPDEAPPTAGAPARAESGALAPADCLAALTELNEAGKLVPAAAFPGTRLKGLAEEGYSGIRLANAGRLVGIDLGPSGFKGSISEQGDDGTFGKPLTFRMMGFLYSDFQFSLAGQTLPAGAWSLEAFNTSLRLVGNHETATRYDPMQRTTVPLQKTIKIALTSPIPESVIGPDASEIPHYTIALDGARVVLRVQGNEWVVTPSPLRRT